MQALILRRCYPVPVTFDDLHKAVIMADMLGILTPEAQRKTTAALKEITGALDEVYAVVDGREVRVAEAALFQSRWWCLWDHVPKEQWMQDRIQDLLDAADKAGYWERPHEVRVVC